MSGQPNVNLGAPHANSTVPYRFFELSRTTSSLAYSADSQSVSQYTVTSSSTVHGIGSLAAKGIRAVGKLQLRVLEWIVIRRKLTRIRRLFPHADDNTDDTLEEVYDAVLELTRHCIYSRK
jgi:hypothetical protein